MTVKPLPWLVAAALAAAVAPAEAANAAAEHECLALNIYWEARSESPRDQAAVAHVTLNRVAHQDFPASVCEVVRQGGEGGCQFSWWCDGRSDVPEERDAWIAAQQMARAVLAGAVPDPTGGALYYHHDTVEPDWAAGMERTAALGAHVFYR